MYDIHEICVANIMFIASFYRMSNVISISRHIDPI